MTLRAASESTSRWSSSSEKKAESLKAVIVKLKRSYKSFTNFIMTLEKRIVGSKNSGGSYAHKFDARGTYAP